jgi:hypothetical protein
LDIDSGGQEEFGTHKEPEIRRAASALGDLFLNLLKSAANRVDEAVPLAEESREHEPGI